jgi:hypothetical protein
MEWRILRSCSFSLVRGSTMGAGDTGPLWFKADLKQRRRLNF